MIEMQAVVRVPAYAAGSSWPWPVASLAARSWLVLDADCADDEVGLFVASLAREIDWRSPADRDEVVDGLLAAEVMIAPGGLRLADTVTGMAVVAGCCMGLETWRDWSGALAGRPPWLGHNPAAAIQDVGDELFVWQTIGRSWWLDAPFLTCSGRCGEA